MQLAEHCAVQMSKLCSTELVQLAVIGVPPMLSPERLACFDTPGAKRQSLSFRLRR